MTPQYLAWSISLALIIVVTLSFIWVAIKSRQPVDNGVAGNPYRLRTILFWVLIALGAVTIAVTVPPPLYVAQNQPPQNAQVVDVVGGMWYWKLQPTQVESGRPVLFNVSSADVNHGLGIYDEDLRLLTQTQAMPGYVNKLVHTFTQPGTYRLMCLEYCGLAHHGMMSSLTVIAAEDGGQP
ncbi:MAG: hypothetical protein QF877_17350 [Gammaproteobacteria bacterium]|jgi:cytochrome c oxidase subunit 2|nr:hypothetical protein [Gammaproteobacteria bacterium]|tara:strand:- start:1563 stop:2105 length:543 start_codon:yes stop_codon:yes gene_type:complete